MAQPGLEKPELPPPDIETTCQPNNSYVHFATKTARSLPILTEFKIERTSQTSWSANGAENARQTKSGSSSINKAVSNSVPLT